MDDTYKYFYKRNKPFIIQLVGFLLIIFTLLRFRYTPIWSIVSGLSSVGIFASREGIELDFIHKKYRLFTSFGPSVIGTWKALSDMKYISVFKTALVSSVEGLSGTTLSKKQKVIQVNLIIGKNQRLRLFETEETDEAWNFARKIASKLDLKVWDATLRKGKWFEQEASLEENVISTPN